MYDFLNLCVDDQNSIYLDGILFRKLKHISYNLLFFFAIKGVLYPGIDAIIDDLMIFSRTLTIDEISSVMYAYTPNDFNRLSPSLTSQWTFNQRFVEEVTGSYLTSPVNVRFVADRLSAANSALYVNYGYVKAPSAVYFNRSLLTF